MKNKLASLLAALLLCLSLLPSQAIATFDSVDNDPPAILEQDEPEAPDDTPDDPEESVSLVPQSNASVQSKDPGLFEGEH